MNLVAVEYLTQVTGEEFMYAAWVVRFLPLVIILMGSNILYLMTHCKKTDTLGGSREYFINQYKAMPRMTREEWWALGLFLVATIMSFGRQLYEEYLPGLKPAYVFIICAILCFIVRKQDGSRLMSCFLTMKNSMAHMMNKYASCVSETGIADYRCYDINCSHYIHKCHY